MRNLRMKNCVPIEIINLPSNGLPEVGSTCSAHPGGHRPMARWTSWDHGPPGAHLVEATFMARGIGHTDRRASHKIFVDVPSKSVGI